MLDGSKKVTNNRVLNQQITRQKLLEAARKAVVKYGYQGASITEIVNLAGFTKGAFFSNFKNKEDILLELLRIQKEEDISLLNSYISLESNNLSLALEKYISTLDERRECAMLDIELQLYARNNTEFAQLYYEIQNTNRVALGNLLQSIFFINQKPLPLEPSELADLFIALVQGTAIQNNLQAGNFVRLVLESLIKQPRTSR